MHYHRHQFGGDKPTIDAKDPKYKYKLGQRNGLSEKDILQFGILYNCPGKVPFNIPAIKYALDFLSLTSGKFFLLLKKFLFFTKSVP